MAKRFTDTNKYKKPFLRGLKGAYKVLWDFLYHECDHAGMWIVDFTIAQIYIGADLPVTEAEAIECFNADADDPKVIVLDGGKKWFLPSFIEFQYGTLNEKNRVHASVISILDKYRLWDAEKKKPLISPLQGVKDKVKDKDKDKDKEKDKDGPIFFEVPNAGIEAERIRFFIPQLMQVWNDHVPDYPAEEEKDFSALNDIAKFIRKHAKIEDDPIYSTDAAAKIKQLWAMMAKHVAGHNFFKNYSLQQVAKHIQSITQDLKNGKSGTGDIGGGGDLQDGFNRIDQMSD